MEEHPHLTPLYRMKQETRDSLWSEDRDDSKESLSTHPHHEHEYLFHDDLPRHHLNITASNPSGYDDSCHNSIPSPKVDKSSPLNSTRKGTIRRDHRANRIMAKMINKRTRCLMHGMTTSHSLFDCEQFNELTYREKISFLLRKKRCIYCAGCHRSYNCFARVCCFTCGGLHATVLHEDPEPPRTKPADTGKSSHEPQTQETKLIHHQKENPPTITSSNDKKDSDLYSTDLVALLLSNLHNTLNILHAKIGESASILQSASILKITTYITEFTDRFKLYLEVADQHIEYLARTGLEHQKEFYEKLCIQHLREYTRIQTSLIKRRTSLSKNLH